jgi:hypothetical protein
VEPAAGAVDSIEMVGFVPAHLDEGALDLIVLRTLALGPMHEYAMRSLTI